MPKQATGVNPWQVGASDFPNGGSAPEKLAFLIRYAILAPSSHNTQPWKFLVQENVIQVFLDTSRWLKVADADQRELHISVGCALENLCIAAQYFSYTPQLAYFPEAAHPDCVAAVTLAPPEAGAPQHTGRLDLFRAITQRHTNHQVYEARPLPEGDQQRLQDSCIDEGITLYLTSDHERKRQVDALLARADAIQFANLAFREELGYWIGQGVFGTPWLLSKLGQLAVTYLNMGTSTAKKDTELLMSAPVLGLLCSQGNDRISQIKVGQCFERIYLSAAILGISLQPMSQLLQVPEVKAALATLVPDAGLYPQQPFRLGYADPEQTHTPRRSLEEVLI